MAQPKPSQINGHAALEHGAWTEARQSFEAVLLTDHTIHRHLANILNKLNVSTRAAAVAQAVRLNLLPPGAEIAVLAGNPMSTGSYALRLKFPAHYAIPAHSHPTDEHVVVVTGALTFGMGDHLDKHASTNKTLTPGGFALMPTNMNHYASPALRKPPSSSTARAP